MKSFLIKNKNLKRPFQVIEVFGEKEMGKITSSFAPGEWILLTCDNSSVDLLGYINPFANSAELFKVVISVPKGDTGYVAEEEQEVAMKTIRSLLDESVANREQYQFFSQSCRLVFGASDRLPGLVVDKCDNYIFIQINTMGIYRFKEVIQNYFEEKFPNLKVHFLNNQNLQKREDLPLEADANVDDWISATENDMTFFIKSTKLQKTGFYFDHRENRKRLESLLAGKVRKYSSSLDLFSYLGFWGFSLLKSGVDKCVFVDQGNFEEEFDRNAEVNNFQNRYEFKRMDAFDFLDKCIEDLLQFDVVISDPPAFVKNQRDRSRAIAGYEKLHKKCLKVTSPNGIFVAASCSRPVGMEDLDRTVQKAAAAVGREVRLVDVGLQSWDHPIESLMSKSNYIKYLAYNVS